MLTFASDMALQSGKYLEEIRRKFLGDGGNSTHAGGLLALSPLLVFLVTYLVSSIVAGDFYKVPVSAAFLLSSVYAIIICRGGKLQDRIAIFSEGAGNKTVLLMLWIFVLAGAFASTAKEIGAIDACVNLTLRVMPGNMLLAGLFIASCIVSMAVGSSVGTIVALVPIAAGLAASSGMETAMVTAVIVGGAFFGDNLSFISDTTIASTKLLGCSMSDKFKANVWIAGPAALAVLALYIFLGSEMAVAPNIGEVSFLRVMPYLLVIVLSVCGMNVLAVLALGILVNAVIGFSTGCFTWIEFMGAIGSGIASMGDLIIVTMLAGGMLEIIRYGGGLDFLMRGLTHGIKGKRGAEAGIAALVSLANFCTANNTVAIISTGAMAKEICDRFGLDPRKVASILDTFSCIVQCVIPYGAQMLMASGLAGVSAFSITGYLYYPLALVVFSAASILLRYPRKYS